MGDRYNIRKEQDEAERYRREVPFLRRVWGNVLALAIISLPFAAAAVIWWLTR